MEGVVAGFHEVKRLEQISEVLIKHELGFLLDKLHLRNAKQKPKQLQPHALVRVCEDLGGSFIKLGQFLSLRPDLLPREYSVAFEKLQDNVPAFPTKVAKERMRAHVGDNLSDVFLHVQDKPIAAASIGQVHKAKLKTGESVAVKVMRPGIKELFMTDLLLIYRLASLIDHHIKPKVFDPLRIVEEFRRYTEGELNYLGEVQALKVVGENFKSVHKIRIPKVYEEFSSQELLVMEYLPGTSLRKEMANLPKARREKLAAEITHILLKMIFIDGYFHADLHPGNIIMMSNNRLGIIDFGIMGILDKHAKEYLTILFLALVDKDIDGVVRAMGKLHFFTSSEDEDALKQDLATVLAPYYGIAVEKFDIAELFLHSLRVAREHDLSVPSHMVLLGKAIVTLKGVVEELDPEFDILAVAKPFMSELLKHEISLKGIIDKASREALQIKSFVTELPQLTSDYFDTANRIETDLKHIGYEIEVFSRDLTLMLRQVLFAFLLFVTVGITIYLWDKTPSLFGVSLFSLISGAISLLLFISFLRTFKRIKF